MSNAAQSRIATSYSRKANRVFLACLIIFWLGAGLFVVSSQANRKNETGPALTGAALNATRDNTGEVKSAKPISTFKRWAAAPSLLASLLPPAPGDPDLVETFASDCTTPKSAFIMGETVCAKISGGPPLSLYPRKFAWVDNFNNIEQKVDITSDPQTNTFTLPLAGPTPLVDFRGEWRVNSISASRSSVRASAFFSVSNPVLPAADLSIYNANNTDGTITAGSNIEYVLWISNRGPDAATNVQVTDVTPANTTFLSGQISNAGWNCTFPAANSAGGTSTCTISSLAPGANAKLTLVMNINSGTSADTTIADTGHISSDTADPHDSSNTPPPNDPNADPSNNQATSRTTVVAGASTATCTLQCPDNVQANANTTENNQRGAHVTFDDAVATGTCGTVTATPASGSFFPVGTTQVNVSSTQGDGSCSFTVTVQDTGNAPTISCPADQSGDANSSCSATFNIGTATATGGTNVTITANRSDGEQVYTCDDFGNCTRNSSDPPFTYGVTTITWIASSHDIPGPYNAQTGDEESHRTGSATCTQTITVNDVTAPTIAATDSTTSADANCQAPVPDYRNTVSDNCSTSISYTQTPAAGTLVGVGSHTVHIEANDNSSNNDGTGNTSTKDVTFTVRDTTPPTIHCPDNISIPNTPGACGASISVGVATATDNCDGSVTPVPSRSDNKPITDPFPVGTVTIHWTATDSAGNSSSCDQTVVVLDNESPTIHCPANITTSTDPGACSANVNPGTATATDNCGDGNPPTVTGTRSDNQPLNAPYPEGTTTIHWTATDSSGNSSSCDQTVTVTDNESPAISCPADITRSTDPGACSANINPGTATATDNCGSPSVTGARSDNQPLNAPYPKGITTITWTATDSSGNHSSCTQMITVNDTEPPAISCPANITTGTDPGTCSAHVYPGTATATDNCGSTTVSGSRSDARPLTDTYPRGTTTITWTATDSSGNQSSCTQTVTVNDTEAPTITFNGQTPSMWPPNHAYHTFTTANFISSVSDNCDSLSINDVYITKATSDEAENAGGSGNTLNDIVIAGDCKSVELRAERINTGNGRVYTIYFKLKDSSGNFTTGSAKVYSPKNQGDTPVDDGPQYTVTSSCP